MTRVADVLFSQGFGTRRACAALIEGGRVSIGGETQRDPARDVVTDGLVFSVDDVAWPFHAKALVVLHKPIGYECSQQPRHHPSVYDLLPMPLRQRGVQAVGRLDADTSGLLLFTDDGALLHRLTAPKHHVTKVYEVGCKHPVTDDQLAQLADGVRLADEAKPVRAAEVDRGDARRDALHGLRMTLTEGKYHQVKRMVAAVGNRVESLHRSSLGPLTLPPDLRPGGWVWAEAFDR